MARKKWKPREIARINQGRERGETPEQIAADLPGRNADMVRLKIARLRSDAGAPAGEPGDEFLREGTEDTQHLSSRSTRIRTLDDLLAHAEVDLSVWEVERYVANQWEVGAKLGPKGSERLATAPLYQVKAWLRRNRAKQSLREVEERILADMEAHAPHYPSAPAVVRSIGDGFLFEPNLPDLHLGKLAWREEAGEDYDLGIARRACEEAIEDLIEKARGFPLERVIVPIGNDLLQIDTLAKTTTSGTPQDTDSRYAKMFQTAERLMVSMLDRLSALAPVEAVIVPGNHDRQTALTLGRVLAAWYRNTDRVAVDAGPKLRKYKQYGVNLIGYTHGSEEKPADLPLIMATEEPRAWAEAKHREWHVGHLHKSKESRFTAGDSFNGVRVRIIPALCPADAWHFSRGYVGEHRSAEAYLWHRDAGYVGHFASTIYTPELARAA